MVKELDKVVKGSKNGVGVVIQMTDDKAGAKKKLQEFAKANGIGKVALTVNKAGTKSPKGYKISDKVKHTVLVYKKKKVVHNFALNKLDEKSVKEIVAAAKKVLGGGVSL